MTKQDVIKTVKESLARNLQKSVSVQADLGQTYRNWLIGLIQKGNQQLMQEQPAPEQGQGSDSESQPEQQSA